MIFARFVPVACFWICLLVAAGLLGLIVLAPGMVEKTDSPSLALRLYAHDATLRRVTLGGAAGLAASAFAFFRMTPLRFGRVRRADGTVPLPNDLAGA